MDRTPTSFFCVAEENDKADWKKLRVIVQRSTTRMELFWSVCHVLLLPLVMLPWRCLCHSYHHQHCYSDHPTSLQSTCPSYTVLRTYVALYLSHQHLSLFSPLCLSDPSTLRQFTLSATFLSLRLHSPRHAHIPEPRPHASWMSHRLFPAEHPRPADVHVRPEVTNHLHRYTALSTHTSSLLPGLPPLPATLLHTHISHLYLRKAQSSVPTSTVHVLWKLGLCASSPPSRRSNSTSTSGSVVTLQRTGRHIKSRTLLLLLPLSVLSCSGVSQK